MNNLQDLKLYQLAFSLAKDVYAFSKKMPAEEKFGMTSQIRRCSSSIPANIAEGAGRNSNKEFLQFLSIANGSSCELETFLCLAFEAGYIEENNKNELVEKNTQIMKMNNKLQESIKRNLK